MSNFFDTSVFLTVKQFVILFVFFNIMSIIFYSIRVFIKKDVNKLIEIINSDNYPKQKLTKKEKHALYKQISNNNIRILNMQILSIGSIIISFLLIFVTNW